MTTENLNSNNLPLPMSEAEEHNWAMLAHLSVLVNLFTGVLGPVVALIIYLMFAKRSRYVAYHAMQSFLFQLIVWYGMGIMWGIVGLLCMLIIGIILLPLACVLTPILLIGMAIAPIYGIIGAVKTSQGQDFKYWLIGDWVQQ
ncbi:MAG: DUF4870 domain-containing protein [Chloroflexota bacterium]